MNRIRKIVVAAAIASLTAFSTIGVALAGDYGDSGGDDSDDGHHHKKKHHDGDDDDDSSSSVINMPPLGDGSLAHLSD